MTVQWDNTVYSVIYIYIWHAQGETLKFPSVKPCETHHLGDPSDHLWSMWTMYFFFFGTPWAKPSLGTLGWMFHMFHIPGKLIKRKCCGDLPTVFFLIILLFAKTEGYTPKYCDYVRYNWIWWDIATIGGMLDSVNDKNHRWERNWGVNQGVKSCNQWQILVRLKIGFAISGQQNIGQW